MCLCETVAFLPHQWARWLGERSSRMLYDDGFIMFMWGAASVGESSAGRISLKFKKCAAICVSNCKYEAIRVRFLTLILRLILLLIIIFSIYCLV